MSLGAIADQATWADARQIDANCDAFAHIGGGSVDQSLTRMQLAQGVGVKQCMTVTKSYLRKPRALAHQDRKSARTDLRIKRSVIAGRDAVETARLIRNHP